MKYRIYLLESPSGMKQHRWHEDFATREEAQARIDQVNAQDKAEHHPEHYVVANMHIDVIRKKPHES